MGYLATDHSLCEVYVSEWGKAVKWEAQAFDFGVSGLDDRARIARHASSMSVADLLRQEDAKHGDIK